MNETPVRILIVDDQPANLISLEALLKRPEYELVLARSGREALAYAYRQDFALILLDVQMPELDGIQTARCLREFERSRSTPIIFLTAIYPSETHASLGYEAGAVDYLNKPINPDVLRAKVAVFVDLYRKNLEIQRQAEIIQEISRREKDRLVAKTKAEGDRKYRRLVEGLHDVIVWSHDPKRRVAQFVSPHAERITGYPNLVWMAEPDFFLSRVHAEDRERVREGLRNTRTGTSVALDHRFIKADGKILWLHTSINCDRDPNDSETSEDLFVLSVDITHLKETERALRESIQVRDEFLSVASHELRTPITPLQLQMQGFIRLLDTGNFSKVEPDLLREMLQISDIQVARLARLIGQLLDVTRLTTGRLALDVGAVDLSETVQSVVHQFDHESEAAECRINLDLAPGIIGKWDRLRLEQVVSNLLLNALKYGAGKPIRISTGVDEGKAVLVIQDQGIGVAKEAQERTFGRFERAVPLSHYGGLGLGLYISRELVEAHSGSISVESEPGQGATFTVRLPLRLESIAPVPSQSRTA